MHIQIHSGSHFSKKIDVGNYALTSVILSTPTQVNYWHPSARKQSQCLVNGHDSQLKETNWEQA